MKNIKEYLRTEQVFRSSSDVILIEGIPRYVDVIDYHNWFISNPEGHNRSMFAQQIFQLT